MEQIIQKFASYVQQLELPEKIIVHGLEFDVQRAPLIPTNGKPRKITEKHLLKQSHQYILYNFEHQLRIAITVQLTKRKYGYYELYIYTYDNRLLTTIPLIPSQPDNEIALNLSVKIYTQKISGERIGKQERREYLKQLREQVELEGMTLGKDTLYLGTYSSKENCLVGEGADTFLENYIKFAILKGHYSHNKRFELPIKKPINKFFYRERSKHTGFERSRKIQRAFKKLKTPTIISIPDREEPSKDGHYQGLFIVID